MGDSCMHDPGRPVVKEEYALTKKERRPLWKLVYNKKELRLVDVIRPNWTKKCAEEAYSITKSKCQDREIVEVRSKIDGLTGSDLLSFRGLRKKDVISFLERSLTEKEKTLNPAIRKIERIDSSPSFSKSGHIGLRLHIVTWNMNGRVACDDIRNLLECKGEIFDIYVIGLQEVPNCDASSVILDALGRNYSIVGASVMLSLQLFIFARNKSRSSIKDIKIDKIGVGGLGGVVRRQKGAVAIAFKYKRISFLFIACHLCPHEHNVVERNAQYQRICQTIFTKAKSFLQSPNRLIDLSGCRMDQYATKCKQSVSVAESDVVIWLGDLNYRIDASRKYVESLVNQNLHKLLKAKDQLSREVEKGQIFHGFCEGPLSFKPTYKYDIGTDDYDTSAKERVPSWTDRILYKVKPAKNITAIMHEYDSIESVKSSDHRPVKALFTVNLGSSNQ